MARRSPEPRFSSAATLLAVASTTRSEKGQLSLNFYNICGQEQGLITAVIEKSGDNAETAPRSADLRRASRCSVTKRYVRCTAGRPDMRSRDRPLRGIGEPLHGIFDAGG